MGKVIAIENQKGGCSKPTVTANLGIGMARAGKRVFLIDADSQGFLSASLGVEEPDELEITLSTILMQAVNDEEINLDDGIIHHEEKVDLLPANIKLSGLEVSLVNTMSREQFLQSYVDKIKDRYDVVLIDSIPSLGILTINALVAADSVLIPVQAARACSSS